MKNFCLVLIISLTSWAGVLGQDIFQFTYQPFGYGKLNLNSLASQGFDEILTLKNTDTTGNGFVIVGFYFHNLGDSSDKNHVLGIGIESLIFEDQGKRTIYSPYESENTISLSKEVLNELTTRSKSSSFVFIEKGEESIVKVSLALRFIIIK